jgi:hypothetical protein
MGDAIIRAAFYGDQQEMRAAISDMPQADIDMAAHAAAYRCNLKALEVIVGTASESTVDMVRCFARAHLRIALTIEDDDDDLPALPPSLRACIDRRERLYAGKHVFFINDFWAAADMCKLVLSKDDMDEMADDVAERWDFDTEAVTDLVKYLRDESSSDDEDDV